MRDSSLHDAGQDLHAAKIDKQLPTWHLIHPILTGEVPEGICTRMNLNQNKSAPERIAHLPLSPTLILTYSLHPRSALLVQIN